MPSLPAGTLAAAGAALLGLLGGALLIALRGKVAGSTLVVPWLWAIAAVAAVTGVEVAGALAGQDAPWLTTARWMAAALGLAPGVALLGAKRPQEGMWQLAVVSLVAICWTPAVLQIVLRPGQAVELPFPMGWLLAAAVLFLVANHILTRYWPQAVLAGAGLALLFAKQWPVGPQDWAGWGVLAGVACLDVAILLLLLGLPPGDEAASELDRRWLDFRDAYGAVWALRIAERVNEAAVQSGWSLRLEWGGFQASEGKEIWPKEEQLAARLLRSLLRRFVRIDNRHADD